MHVLFGTLRKVYESRGTPAYEAELDKLPPAYRNTWHELLRLHAQFAVHIFEARRAREGVAELKKSSYKKKTDPMGLEYYQNCVGELTKNHRQDKEDRRKGLIPFVNHENGWNPGILTFADF